MGGFPFGGIFQFALPCWIPQGWHFKRRCWWIPLTVHFSFVLFCFFFTSRVCVMCLFISVLFNYSMYHLSSLVVCNWSESPMEMEADIIFIYHKSPLPKRFSSINIRELRRSLFVHGHGPRVKFNDIHSFTTQSG